MMKTRKITTAAFLAGATTLAVTLPVLGQSPGLNLEESRIYLSELYGDFIDTAAEIDADYRT